MYAIGTSSRGVSEAVGASANIGGIPGFSTVTGGHCRSQRKEPLTWQYTRSEAGGDDGNRTHVQGFAGPCLNHSATSPCQVTMPRPGQDGITIRSEMSGNR